MSPIRQINKAIRRAPVRSSIANNRKIITNASIMQRIRAQLSSSLSQYGGNRDYMKALGYDQEIELKQYFYVYKRMGIAKRIIDAPARDTWRGAFSVSDNPSSEKQSPFEKGFYELFKKHKLASVFQRVDRLSAIGHFGLLLVGFDDGKALDQEVTSASSILYLQPYSQESITIQEWEDNPASERYGLPKIYKIKKTETSDSSTSLTTRDLTVHWSRVIHIAEDKTESEVIGIPRLKPVWNYLYDLLKVSGGSAEMYWRNADPKIIFETGSDASVDMEEDEMREKLDEIENGLRRAFILNGMSAKYLSPELVDPSPSAEVQFKLISAATGIPLRILTGSERGELASTQDREAWLSFLEERRFSFAEPDIVRPFIDRCIKVGVLPKPKENKYNIIWSDVRALGTKEKADLGRVKSEALSYYLRYPYAQEIIPVDVFLQYIMGEEEENVSAIKALIEQMVTETPILDGYGDGEPDNVSLGEEEKAEDEQEGYREH